MNVERRIARLEQATNTTFKRPNPFVEWSEEELHIARLYLHARAGGASEEGARALIPEGLRQVVRGDLEDWTRALESEARLL